MYQSGQVAYSPDLRTGVLRREVLGDFLLLGAHLRYSKPSWGEALRFSLDVRNLLDTPYVVGSQEPRAGREVLLGLGARY